MVVKADHRKAVLIAIDPALAGKVIGRFPWRGENYESCQCLVPSHPVRGPGVFVTQCYEGGGGVLLQLTEDGFSEIWKNEDLGAHWMNPVLDAAGEDTFSHRWSQPAETRGSSRLISIRGKELWDEVILWQDIVDGRPYNLGIQRASLLQADGATLCLGELGSLLWLQLDRDGAKVLARHQPFLAPQSWTLPALSQGLLFLMQNEEDHLTGAGPRLRCYDLRGSGEQLTKPTLPR